MINSEKLLAGVPAGGKNSLANVSKAMITDLSPKQGALSGLQRISRWLVIIVLTIAVLVLAGWEWDIVSFQHLPFHQVAMNPMTAVAIILIGISLSLITSPDAGNLGFTLARIMASIVLLIAFLRLFTLFPRFLFSVDLILFRNKPGLDSTGPTQARMAYSAAASLILLGSGLLLMSSKSRGNQVAAQTLAIAAGLPPLFSFIGYLYRVQEFYGIFRHLPMAIHTAGCFFLLSLAFLFARPHQGIMQDFTSGLAGSIHARQFIPVAILAPVILGFLRMYGYWKGLFSTEFGVTILVFSIILVFIWTIYYSALLLNKRDRQNQAISADLQASEHRLRLLVNSIQDYAIFMVDASGNIASWNTGAEKIKGYNAEEIIGKSISIFYSPADVEKGEPQHNLEMAKALGRYHSEGWRVRKDGTRFWADIVFTPIYDQQGQLQGFAKITRDRTEFKKAQEQIAYQARLMEDTSDAVISIDPLYKVVSWNKAAEQLYGYSAREVIGRDYPALVRSASPQDAREAALRQMNERGHWKGEVTHYHKNGARLELLFSISQSRDNQGKVDGYVMVGRDIAERKREEQQLRHFNELLEAQVKDKTAELRIVFERVSDGFMAFDKSGLITYVNQKAAEMNLCAPEDLIGKNFWKRFPTATRNEFSENFHRALDTQQNIHFEMFSPSLQLWIECFMYPSEDGLSLFFRDISEKKKAEEAISRGSEELRQLASHLQDIREEERATIAREIHDELGQQLTGIKMDISWIAKRLNKAPDDPLPQKITGTLGLLDNTIKTVRRIATELRPSILDDLGLIAAIEWQSQEFKKRSGINTNFRSSVNELHFEPATAIGLFRICQESLTNVARHAAAKNVWINLDWADDQLTLLIRDDGKGMNKKVVGDKKTLGLLGMKERALMMGGSLDIRSGQDNGMILEVTVPLKEPTS